MKRGEMYWFNLGDRIGSEAEGRRLGIIVSTDILNDKLETVIVVPTSSADLEKKRKHWNNIYLSKKKIPELPEESVAQAHLVRHISMERLENPKRIAMIPRRFMDSISVALGEAMETRNPKQEILEPQ